MSEPEFALFHGEYYYPGGGWDDYDDTFTTLEAAKGARVARKYEWAHVVDLSICEVVARRAGLRGWETT